MASVHVLYFIVHLFNMNYISGASLIGSCIIVRVKGLTYVRFSLTLAMY